MRKLPYLFAVAAVSGLALSAGPSSASPLASGLAGGNATLPELSEGLVQKVHGWHCRKRLGWYRGDKYWHRNRRACNNQYSYGVPALSFGIIIDDDDNRGRRHHKNKKYKKSY